MAEESNLMFFEVLSLPGVDSLARLDVLYKLDESFFIPSRSFDSIASDKFKLRGEVLIEIADHDDISRAREIHRIEMETLPPKRNQVHARWYERIATFSVAPGVYSVSVEVSDLESNRRVRQRSRPIHAGHFAGDKTVASSLLFVTHTSSDTLNPANFGGNVLISATGGMFVQFHLPGTLENDHISVRYSLREASKDRDSGIPVADSTVSVSLLNKNLLTVLEGGRYSLSKKEDLPVYSLFVPLPLEQLRLRHFDLNAVILAGNDSIPLQKKFQTVWPGMPRSLRDVEMAIEALRFITRKEELDSLKSGSHETRIRNLEGFWQAKDRAPETAINETMVEYYRRVDHAMVTFGTLRAPDGTRNDRGRIYILHGPPTEIERSLDTEGAREIWTYQHMRKRFIFADKTRTGLYELVSTQTL